MARIVVLHNTDFEAGAIDASSVADAAKAVAGALREHGHAVEITGLHGTEILDLVPRLQADLVFNLCESMNNDARNEPTVAGLFDLFGIRYTGADQLALVSCLHKQRAKEILIGRGVATPPYRYLASEADLADVDGLDYPWFVKLAHEDASVGITEANRVTSAAELRARTRELLAQYRQPVLAERYVEGREVNATLIGNGADLTVLPLHEIDFAAMPGDRPKIVSYAAKWDEHHVDYAGTKPVPLRNASPALITSVERVARASWDALGMRDYGRIDLRVDAASTAWVIDINPNPDISPDAGVARAAQLAGMSYPQLIARIADVACRRIDRRGQRSTAPAAQ